MDPVIFPLFSRLDTDPLTFLAASRIIDHGHSAIRGKARELAADCNDVTAIAERFCLM